MTPHNDSSGSGDSPITTPLNTTLNPNTNTPALVENNDNEFETHHLPSKDANNVMNIQWNAEFPPGYRFCPTDGELIYYYLQRKIMNLRLPHDKIKDVVLSRYNPEKLCEEYLPVGDNEWYFFTPRDRKYRNGERPNRAAGTGYWKATGADKNIPHPRDRTLLVGHKNTLVFYDGRPPRGVKSNWIMHEYKTEKNSSRKRLHETDMRLDDWVLCRIYKKNEKSSKGNNIKVKPSNEGKPNSDDDQDLPLLPELEIGVEEEKLATQIEPISNLKNYHQDNVLGDNQGLFLNNDYPMNTLDYPRPLSPQLPDFPPIFSEHPDFTRTYLDTSYVENQLYNFPSDDYLCSFRDTDVKPLRQHCMISEPGYSPPLSDNKLIQIPKYCNGETTSVSHGTNTKFKTTSCKSEPLMEEKPDDQSNNIDINNYISMLKFDFDLDDVDRSK